MSSGVEAAGANPQYANPPIDEGVVQLTLMQPARWGIETPGRLYERCRDRYPSEPEQSTQLQAEFGQGDQPNSGSLSLQSGFAALRFLSEDHKQTVNFTPWSISAHSMRPYEGWESLENRLYDVLELIDGIYPIGAGFSSVGTRYINRVTIPTETFQLEDYFQLSVATPFQGATLNGFFLRTENTLTAQDISISATFASLRPDPEQEDESASNFIIDLDCVYRSDAAFDLSESRQLARTLRAVKNEAFENCITDQTREIFR